MERTRWKHRLSDGLGWALIYAALWALFSEGGGWSLGVPTALLAAGVSVWLGMRPWHPTLSVLPGFIGFFLGKMVAGAWDVAVRALHPGRSLQPAWLVYPLTAHSPQVRLVLSALVGLLPGTLASRVDGDSMRVHVLDQRQPWEPTVRELEQRLQRLLTREPLR
ncbi:Na+/H+ antiporter subunit E [Stutzerimonas stutzeri]|uniref:Na+/H+ antiporter subunit E n=1 Tax=Stutzerimonas stutzeri TaxID=316 RepID=UPI00210D4B46|nr:Na+/H+ antiporter subunit E [Stutzerimonas stutzeri]MCQ4257185.1 Na+/H+ antiporter subunit E [Stutzerimonas stutzeri]